MPMMTRSVMSMRSSSFKSTAGFHVASPGSDPKAIAALTMGMDAVLVLGCHPGDCHYVEGNLHTRRRALLLGRLLEAMGLEPERFQLRWVSAAEGRKFADVVREVVRSVAALGPNPLGSGNGR